MKAKQATYEILYNGRNITADISEYVLSIQYTDKATGEADEIEIQLEDSKGMWQFDWYPVSGDKISLRITTLNGTLDCGIFTVDTKTGSFSADGGDNITIKALAAGIDKSMRTVKFYAHENKTLREIASTIAANNGLTLEGQIPDVRIQRKTQYKKTDLHFLQCLANDYGYTFSVRENRLTFTNIFDLEGRQSSLSFRRNEINSVDIEDSTSGTFSSAEVKFHNPRKNEVVSHSEDEKNETFAGAKVDKLVIRQRAENAQQAEILSKVALYRANSFKQAGSMNVEGNIFLLAGNNIDLLGFGMFSGKYHVTQSTHNVSKSSGYTTSAEIKRVGLVEKKDYR